MRKADPMPFYLWSQTANNNGNADPTIGWPEGMAPSQVNDSARAMMAATAKYRDDIAGAIVTAGTSTAYTVSSYEVFDTLPHLSGQMIAFSPHATNGATVTLNVDGLGAKPLRSAPNAELLAGTIIQGTPYVAVYNNSDGAFYLQGFYGNPYNVPLGAGMDYWLPTAPNSSFVFPIGQAISRTTYATLFVAMSNTYGSGDGSTTFNLPDKRGRVSAMKETTPTLLTSSYFGGLSTGLGAAGGGESNSLGTPNLPPYTPAGNVAASNLGENAGGQFVKSQAGGAINIGGSGSGGAFIGTTGISASFSGNAQGGTSTPFRTVQPTIICNYIIRVI
jgi:microcystin-dependent protein